MQIITFWDYLLLPLYLVIIYQAAFAIRDRFYPEGHPWRPFFIRGLSLKIGGALFIALLYQYYYGTGDTVQYFKQGAVLNSSFAESPAKWINLITHNASWYEGGYQQYLSEMPWYGQASTAAVLTASALISALTFNTFLPASIIFAAIAYTGIWALFRTFALQYPHIRKGVALAILFIPSTFVWGSGIFKDTMCMFSLGWMTYGVFQLIVQRNFSLSNVGLTALGFYLVAVIKIYILVAFMPALIIWVLFTYSQRISSGFLRFSLKWIIFGVIGAGFPAATAYFSESLGKYSLDNVMQTSTITRTYLESITEIGEGSNYSLGEIDPTSAIGMLEKFPLAVNVSLFRPYLWESRKPIQFLNALEASMFLFITLKLLFLIGPRRVWKAINEDANIQFCLIFTLIFAFAVGISTYNFGSLSRYRIPCLPLYGLALVLIYYKYRPPEANILGAR